MQKLNLTPEQKEKMLKIRTENRAQSDTIRKEIDSKRNVFHKLAGGNATDAELKKAHDDMQALHQKLATAHFENLLAVRAILKPEQRKIMMEQVGDRLENRRGKKGGGMGMGGGMMRHGK
jgi:Spy/CpxP family protein refolding chaperone